LIRAQGGGALKIVLHKIVNDLLGGERTRRGLSGGEAASAQE
jgi:hypothetical protein